MLTMHGVWADNALLVWGETDVPTPPRRGRRTAREEPPEARAHPFAADPAAVAHALSLPSTAETRILCLPSRLDRPLGAAESLGEEPPELKPWRVPGIRVLPEEILGALVPRNDTAAVGADFQYWQSATLLALEVLAAQRCLPAVGSRDGVQYAAWEPLFSGPSGQRRSLLIRAMPGACRCAMPQQNGDPPPSPEKVLDGFLCAVVDAAARAWLSGSPLPPRRGRRPADDDYARDWLAALRSTVPQIEAPPEALARLAEAVASWSAEARQAPGGAFRTCFRLDAPDEENTGWALSYLLQATDDPSLMVPADKVWRHRGATARLLDRELKNPQEPFLADLGRAGRIVPPVESSLRSARPSGVALTAEEAHGFLREWAWLLEEAGFGVLVPPWWDRRRGTAARLGLRAKVHAPGAQSGSGQGLTLKCVLEFDWQIALGDEPLSPEELAQLAALKSPLVKLRGQWVELKAEQIDAALKFLARGESTRLDLPDALRLGLGEGEIGGLPVTGIEPVGPAAALFESLRAGDHLTAIPAPSSLHAQLRPYQERGLAWLAFLRRWGLGACLADDMGLGKTIQAIALLLLAREAGEMEWPALLVCPTSVIGNWQRELARFAPDLRVLVHHGPSRASGTGFEDAAGESDLVITSYALLSRDEQTLATYPWSTAILDEAQNIKNPGARQTQAARKLRADSRIAMTGTPVENRLSELWSILEFLNPGYLGSREGFRRDLALPIERTGDEDAARRLRQLTQPFILRRLKTDPAIIQDLPEKIEMNVYCSLTREQVTLYEAVTKDALEQIETREGMERRGLVLATMMRLKQICNHPAQLLADGSAVEGRSGKLNRLAEMLEEVLAEGDRALIFTQFHEMGDLLRQALTAQFGREVLFLHGGTPRKARDEMVRRFQEDPKAPALFILSLKAGGVGLNLTAASHVFHFDRWWNPAVENQATDRAFRIGQKQNVQVRKFVCTGTLEEKIDEMLERKRALAEKIVGDGEGWLTELSTDELRSLFTLSRTLVEE